MDFLTIAGEALREGLVLAAEAGGEAGGAAGEEPAQFQINFFWIITQAVSFLIFLAILYVAAFRRIGGVLEERRSRIEQGLRDAEQARKDRERAEQERAATIAQARTEANDILVRAQKLADESRARDMAATREDLERMRTRAAEEIESEKQRAIADLRAEVADLALAAAGKVVGESMTGDRQRRLVQEFLAESAVVADGAVADRRTAPGTAPPPGSGSPSERRG